MKWILKSYLFSLEVFLLLQTFKIPAWFLNVVTKRQTLRLLFLHELFGFIIWEWIANYGFMLTDKQQ